MPQKKTVKKVAKKATTDERTLLVSSRSEGTFKITIPADWKVTFGAFQTGKFGGEGGSALRIYEAENKQRACFVNVISFRDLAIPVERLVKQKSGESTWEDDGTGNSSRSEKVKTTEEWLPS